LGLLAAARAVAVVADPTLVNALAQAARDEADARREECEARARLRAAVAEQASLAEQLQAQGTPLIKIARWIARTLGQPLSVESLRRIATRLRQRVHRHRVTSGHRNVSATITKTDPHWLSVQDEARMPRVSNEEMVMGRLIKRVTRTEESWFDEDGDEAIAGAAEGAEDEEADEPDDEADDADGDEEDDDEQDEEDSDDVDGDDR